MKNMEIIVARFKPARTDDMVAGADICVGKIGQWMALWIIGDGQYAGQWAMAPYRWNPWPPFAWAPLCDLEVIQ